MMFLPRGLDHRPLDSFGGRLTSKVMGIARKIFIPSSMNYFQGDAPEGVQGARGFAPFKPPARGVRGLAPVKKPPSQSEVSGKEESARGGITALPKAVATLSQKAFPNQRFRERGRAREGG